MRNLTGKDDLQLGLRLPLFMKSVIADVLKILMLDF